MGLPAFKENFHTLSKRRVKALAATDDLSPGLRACVHEYGYAIVNSCMNFGVVDPKSIRQLVHEIWEGARQPSQRREANGKLDWLLIQAGANISAATLLRVLADNHLIVVPHCPTRAMIEASMREVSGFTERVTKEEKHTRRLRAALLVALKEQQKPTKDQP